MTTNKTQIVETKIPKDKLVELKRLYEKGCEDKKLKTNNEKIDLLKEDIFLKCKEAASRGDKYLDFFQPIPKDIEPLLINRLFEDFGIQVHPDFCGMLNTDRIRFCVGIVTGKQIGRAHV